MSESSRLATKTVSSKSGGGLDEYVKQALKEITQEGGHEIEIQFSAASDRLHAMIIYRVDRWEE